MGSVGCNYEGDVGVLPCSFSADFKDDRSVSQSSVEEALEAAGLWSIKNYIWRRQATISEYIDNRPIYELFTDPERIMVSSRLLRWWDKDLTRE